MGNEHKGRVCRMFTKGMSWVLGQTRLKGLIDWLIASTKNVVPTCSSSEDSLSYHTLFRAALHVW